MAADLSYWMAIAGRAVLVFFFAVVVVVVCVVFIFVCTIGVKAWWQSPRMRLFRLGGVTTLRRKLNYPCTLCQDSMEAGDKVRTLSCDHVFHCSSSVKCEKDIDKWLRTGPMTSCPICRQIPIPCGRGSGHRHRRQHLHWKHRHQRYRSCRGRHRPQIRSRRCCLRRTTRHYQRRRHQHRRHR